MQKYSAKKAGDASIDLYLAHYIEAHQPFLQNAVVVDVRDKMFEVIVLKTGSVVRVNASVRFKKSLFGMGWLKTVFLGFRGRSRV